MVQLRKSLNIYFLNQNIEFSAVALGVYLYEALLDLKNV